METKSRKIKSILLTQPNYAWLSKRTWLFPPYTLCLLKAIIKGQSEAVVFDPNFKNLSEHETKSFLQKTKPDLVGVSSVSTEYFNVTRHMVALIRECLPEAVIVLGGVIPTVMIEEAMKDKSVDYWIMGEGERSFPLLIEKLRKGSKDFSDVSGLAYWQSTTPVINKMEFVSSLDEVPFPDYSAIAGATLCDYGNIKFKYAPGLLARQYPSAVTITSRGCPYRCIFCAGRTISGAKVRFRSAENVLEEVGILYKKAIREVIFLDDHFLANRNRALKIMNGILESYKDLTWKCVNVTAWLLDDEILRLMYKSGCTHITVSIESGNQNVLTSIIKKPIRLDAIPAKLDLAKSIGFDIIANFVVGFPGETWEQIRDTFKYAEKLNVDIVNFHIATPLPKTELMDICLKNKLLPVDYLENIAKYSGYGKGLITTKEFTPFELEVLRSFEWDRINFSSPERKKSIARMNGITMEELEDWRMNTRRNLGVNSVVKNIMTPSNQEIDMVKQKPNKKNVFILGISSDIGKALAEEYLKDGFVVSGTYRQLKSVKSLLDKRGICFFKCDVGKKSSVKKFADEYRKSVGAWDIFISCVGSMEPIGKFFEMDFDKWEQSVLVNSMSQLRFLHQIYPYRRKGKTCHVVFFAGGGTNNPFTNYSAYCAAKIMLIKMGELLDDENKDLNIFIIGPGWVRTKIHDQTLNSRSSAGCNYNRTLKFLNSKNPGTDYQDIYDCINWCIGQGVAVSGGRNFSVVHDHWRNGGIALARQLRAAPDKFKLRRFKNK